MYSNIITSRTCDSKTRKIITKLVAYMNAKAFEQGLTTKAKKNLPTLDNIPTWTDRDETVCASTCNLKGGFIEKTGSHNITTHFKNRNPKHLKKSGTIPIMLPRPVYSYFQEIYNLFWTKMWS